MNKSTIRAIYEGSLIEETTSAATTSTSTSSSTPAMAMTAAAAGEAKADVNDEIGMIELQMIFKRIRTKKLLPKKIFGQEEENEKLKRGFCETKQSQIEFEKKTER